VAAQATVAPIDTARWAEAQAGELEFWQSEDRTALARYLDGIYMAALGINLDSIRGLSVLDLGGGPMPMAALMQLPVLSLTVVDPLPCEPRSWPSTVVHRVVVSAEDYTGPSADEVWGYNVLQHVRDPEAVLNTAKSHARLRVRWYDWVDSKIEPHHPHSISAEWLISQFDGWRLTVCTKGSVRVPKVQHFCAIVAERT
jgi:hypothetical protein